MGDTELHENTDQSVSLYELFRNDIEDLGESSPNWWHEELETRKSHFSSADNEDSDFTSNVRDCRSPVFKTPQFASKKKRNKSSCGRLLSAVSGQKRSRVTSPGSDGSSELDWYSPFKSSKLSPIPLLPMGSGTVPESLEPLLEDGSDMSWNSAFATPLSNIHTRSCLNSDERKVLMPTDSSKSPRVLFSPDESLDTGNFCESKDLNTTTQKDVSGTTFLVENSVVDKTELNIQHSLLSSKENILCFSTPSCKVLSKKNVDTPLTENCGNVCRLEETVLNTVNKSVDIKEKFNERKDIEELSQGIESKLIQKMHFSGSKKEMNQCNSFRRHVIIKSPDSGVNDFTENNVEIDFGNSSPLVGRVNAGLTVSRKLFHDNKHKGVHAGEGSVTQHGIAAVQLEEDMGAVACDEVSHVRLSGSVGAVECLQSNPAASNEIEVIASQALHSPEDFPQDLSVNTLEEICQVTELLAASTNTPIECPQDVVNTDKNRKAPVCDQLSLPEKSYLCRTSTPIVCPDKHSRFNSGSRKRRIKFVHVPGNKTPNKNSKNIRLVKEHIQKSFEFEEKPHGGDTVLEQATSEFNSSENNSAVDIALRVQAIKLTGNKFKKFIYVPDSMEMKAAFTQNKSMNILVDDVIKSAETMEKVIGTKAKHNDVRKFNISCDRQELMPFCKLQEPLNCITSGEPVEHLKRINALTSRTDGTVKYVRSLRSCYNSLSRERNNDSSSINETCVQVNSLSNQDSIKEFINASGNTKEECNDVSSVLYDFETCKPEEQSGAIINLHDTRNFLLSHETKAPFNASNTTCNMQEHFNEELDELPSSSKKELEYEFSRLSQSTKMLGFSTVTGKQIILSDNALLKVKRSTNDIMTGEVVKVIPDVASKVPSYSSKCVELQDTKFNAVCLAGDYISCKHSNSTTEEKCDVSDNVSRQGHVLNNKFYDIINSSVMCASNNNKLEIVMHAETKTLQNYNFDKAVNQESTQSLLEKKRDQEHTTDLQIVLAAEHVEFMQQLADDGSIFSQWPNDVHDQESENCEKINNPPTESKFHVNSYTREGCVSSSQKETCATTHVAKDPLNDVSVSNDGDKHSSGELTSLCSSGHQDIKTSIQDLQQGRLLHHKNIVCDSTVREEKENGNCHKVVENVKSSDNEVKPHSEEVYMEEILNATVIRQLFSDSLDTFKIENRAQTTINKPKDYVLRADHSLPTALRKRMQSGHPEMAVFHAASRERDVSLQRPKACSSECDASNGIMIKTVPSKSQKNLDAVNGNMSTKMEPAELSRTIGRNRVMSGTALKNILFPEAELQKSETIQTVDTGSNKMVTLNTANSEVGLLEDVGKNEEMSKTNMLLSSNDNSFQTPVTDTRHLFQAESSSPLQHPNVNCQRVGVGKSVLDTTETLCFLFRTENYLQLPLPQRVSTANCQPVSVCEKIVDISDQLSVDNQGVPDKNVAVSSRLGQNHGNLLQSVGNMLYSSNSLEVDSYTTISGMKIVPSAIAMRNVEHKFPKIGANVNSTLKNVFSPVSEVPEILDSSLIHTVSEFKRKGELHSPVLQGFSTASGKKVSVSATALNRARLLFTEEESCTELVKDGLKVPELRTNEEPPMLQGFSTASGKKVSVSATALNRARLLFTEEESCTELVKDGLKVPELRTNEEPPMLQGFSTASGKKVSVSATALNRARLLFTEEESCTELVKDGLKVPELRTNEEPPMLQGFSTASGKKVSVSATALNRARLLFTEEESCTELVKDGLKVPELRTNEEPPMLQGFSTASGKKVSVSATALNRARLLFTEEESCTELVKDGLKVPELRTNEEPPMLQGFSTASGKKVSVSATALNRARLLFTEEESCTELVKDGLKVPELRTNEEPPMLQGFSTASGKKVSVSATALNRARLLFTEEESCTELVKDGLKVPELRTNEEPPMLQGFSTASGKKVSVSATALNRARLLFTEEESCTELVKDGLKVPELRTNEEPPMLQGFSTASGKKVSVSATALNRAKLLFLEEEAEGACTKKNVHEVNFSDFNVKQKIVSKTFQELLPTSVNHDCVSAEALNRNTEFSLEEEQAACISISNTNYLEFEKPSLITETSAQLEKMSVSKEKPRKVKVKLSRRIAVQNKSNSLFEIPQSEQINSCRPFFFYVNERDRQDGKQNTCISDETYVKAGTLNRFTNTPEFKRKLHHISCTEADSHSTGITAAKVTGVKERCDTVVVTRPPNGVTTECSKTDKVSMSLTQEVQESAAALLADEATFDSPSWVVSYVSCPDMLYDQDAAPTALVCSEDKDSSTVTIVDPGSPVLGSHDRCRKRRRVKTISDDLGHSSNIPASSSFKVPYKNSTSSAGDISTPVRLCPVKRTARHLEFGTPFAKHLRTPELRKETGCQEPCRKELLMGEREVCPEVAAGRKTAGEEQAALVRSRISSGNSRMRPCKGSYYVRKEERHLQMKWREAVWGTLPGQYTYNQLLEFGVKESVINITAANAAEFRFSAWDYYSQSLCLRNVTGIPVGDGACLVLDSKGTAGVEEVVQAFLSSPGIEPILVPAGWVHNHYRWLVWKLASVERSFPLQFASRCLTPNMLLFQLKYRYDREVDHYQRPALRKILEHDDSAAKRLVLCVARIIKLDCSEKDLHYELELTDGWYSITAVVDQELCQRIQRGTVAVGTKLISYGAELLNCEQGCSPLEIGSDVKLKLCSNSTRRARWDTKLGFHTHPGPLPVSLTSILPSGGIVSCVSVTVVRAYPLLYVEKLDEGRSVSRSVWAEEKAAAQWQRRHQECVEQIYSQLKLELQQKNSSQRHLKSQHHVPNAKELALICSGEKLCDILELAPDPASVEALLTEEQKYAVADYQRSKHENMQQELEARVRERLKDTAVVSRNVTPLFKVRCVDPGTPKSTQSAMLSVWRPSEDVMQLLKEGITVTLFSISAVGVRSGALQLSAGRKTAYKPSSRHSCDYRKRRVTSLSEAACTDFCPPFGEIDVVGMVTYIGAAVQGNSGFQTVYLADTDFNVLGLSFWGGVKQFGWEEVLKPRALVAASNLQWRHGASVRWVLCAYISELSSFSVNPRQPHLQQALTSLRQEIGQQDFDVFFSACEDKVSALLRGCTSSLSRVHSGRTTFGDSPQTSVTKGVRRPLMRNPINSSKSVSPQVACTRKRMPLLSSPPCSPQDNVMLMHSSNMGINNSPVEQRLHKLHQYGEPPPLPPLVMIPVQPVFLKEFHIPLRIEGPLSSVDSSALSLVNDPG
ncbi:uncharacterized protein LOC110836322 isoform X2 [Zootermopsis nevadensis]|uniref:uncharacterized protein LOC110836322 isoform X2 n=1 Tax=Zootermopsis nevadensis TaxID=136037 RepID=UPI000B8E7498|nr:uncharacterized protein LOC110836322 isoform X2 [Zootermopsis nevadensis]